MKPIPYGRQSVVERDVEAVVGVLRSDFLTQGPVVPRFEQRVADHCGVPYAIAVSSATAALHIACQALGLKPGKTLWTTPITFVATSNAALYCGADVDFVDIDPVTANMSVAALEAKLADAKKQGKLPHVVAPVHLMGNSCDMEAIHGLAKIYGFKIIEDASHAIGGKYQGRPVGDCRFSDCTVFSFHPVKIITTAEGGLITTRDPDLRESLMRLRSHGITRDPERMEGPSHGPWYYQQIDLGFNYRLTELQAALGLSQMDQLDAFVEERHRIVERYRALLAGLPLRLPVEGRDSYSAWHLYVVRLDRPDLIARHRQIFESLRDAKIEVNVHYIPVPSQPYYRKLGFHEENYPEALRYYRAAITLPIFPGLTEREQEHVATTLKRLLA